MPEPQNTIRLQPVEPAERVVELDALRGIALAGILLANARQLLLPWEIAEFPLGINSPPLLVWLDWGVYDAFIDLKFISLFSVLFGIGFALQCERIERRGAAFRILYLRRVLILAAFGLAHGLLLYPAEVLFPYAIGGVLLLALKQLEPSTLVRTGLVLLGTATVWGYQISVLGRISVLTTLVAAVLLGLAMWLVWRRGWRAGLLAWLVIVVAAAAWLSVRFHGAAPAAEVFQDYRSAQAGLTAILQGDMANAPAEYRVRAAAELPDLFALHAHQYGQVLFYFVLFLLWRTLGIFMIGAGLFRMNVRAVGTAIPWADVARISLAIGVPLSTLATVLHGRDVAGLSDARWPEFLHVLTALPLAAGYAALVFLLQSRPAARGVWARVEAAGRMALTNYIGQSLVLSVLAEPWGLGLYAQLDGPQITLVALAVYAGLAELSHQWLARYRMGPLEWLWRCGTYGRWLPNR